MAVSSPQTPNLTPAYGNIIDVLNQRANIESKNKGNYGLPLAIAQPLANEAVTRNRAVFESELKNQLNDLDFERQIKKEGRKLLTPDIIRQLETESHFDEGSLSSMENRYLTEDETEDVIHDAYNKLAADETDKEKKRSLLEKAAGTKGSEIQLTGEVSKDKPRTKQFVGQAGGKAVLFNSATGDFEVQELPGGTDLAPRTKRILPAETVNQLSDFKTLKSQVQLVKDSFDKAYVGPVAARVGEKGQVIEAFAKEERGIFLANINSIRNQLIYLRSGKQINEKEYERMIAELPDENSSVTDFNAKLKNFDKVFTELMTNRIQSFEEGGYLVPENIKELKTSFIIEKQKGKILSIRKIDE